MNALIDTNVVLDAVTGRVPFSKNAEKIFILTAKMDYIIIRNTKDFINSPVKAITPEDFLTELDGL